MALQAAVTAQNGQAGEPQITPAMAYHQLASLLQSNPNATPLIAQALHNMQNGGASGTQGGFTEVASEAAAPHADAPRRYFTPPSLWWQK